MKTITLADGSPCFVDDQDYEELSMYRWHNHQGYACRSVMTEKGCRKVRMHKQILGLPMGKPGVQERVVDHIDRNKLNNTRVNLRLVSKQQNEWNRGARKDNSSGYTGVTFAASHTENPWVSQIKVNGATIKLGCFPTPELAYIAYLEAKIPYHLRSDSCSGVG